MPAPLPDPLPAPLPIVIDTDIGADPDDLTVSYTVVYTKRDGGGFTDAVELQLQERDGSFLIAGETEA